MRGRERKKTRERERGRKRKREIERHSRLVGTALCSLPRVLRIVLQQVCKATRGKGDTI